MSTPLTDEERIDAYRIGYGPFAMFGIYRRLYIANYRHRICWNEARRMYRRSSDRWHRNWQAEWTGCQTAQRAWTKRGVIRKARFAIRVLDGES